MKLSLKVGQKITVTKSYAKWEAANLDMYFCNGKVADGFRDAVAMWVLASKGAPVTGKIVGFGSGCYKVQLSLKAGKLTLRDRCYLDAKNFRKVGK